MKFWCAPRLERLTSEDKFNFLQCIPLLPGSEFEHGGIWIELFTTFLVV